MATAALLQQGVNTTGAGGTAKPAGHGKSIIPLVAGLPVVVVIVTVVVVLVLILVWLNYRSKKKQFPSSAAEYQKLPVQDIGPVMNLPYPSSAPPRAKSIKLPDPPVPGTTTEYIEATSLSGYPGSRYPFNTDTERSSSSQSNEQERTGKIKKPRRLGSRRVSNPLDVKFRSSDRSSSPGSEDSWYGPSKVPGSPASRSAAITPPPSPTMRRSSVMEEAEKKKGPELFLSLLYKESDALLKVKVERAVGLPDRADGTPVDAYVRLFFIPNLAELPQRRTNKTKTQRRENSPVFNEEVEYEAMSMEELINSNLHVEVLDYRSYGKDMVLGKADVPLVQVRFVRGEASITLPLKLPRVRGEG